SWMTGPRRWMSMVVPALALSTKSTAPSSSARMVTSAPSVVRVLSISTAVGATSMILRNRSRPSPSGRLTSRMITSGRSVRASASPSEALPAAPITSTPSSGVTMRWTACRTKAESSTRTTRIGSAIGRAAVVDHPRPPHRLETVGNTAQALGVAEEEVSAREEELVEAADRAGHAGIVEIDQHVSAEYHVLWRQLLPPAIADQVRL